MKHIVVIVGLFFISFRIAGREENEHKKFWKIYSYFLFLQKTKRELGKDGDFSKWLHSLYISNDIYRIFQETCNANDMEIIYSHREELGMLLPMPK
jgi:hypothetical protein